jgi:GR25 family glycosyltransferase involved in LPS biosynthesis
MYVIKSPNRDTDNLVSDIEKSGNTAVITNAVWAKSLSEYEISRILENEYELEFMKLQIGWRDIETAEWACPLSHHNVYKQAFAEFDPNDNWICVMEDDIHLNGLFRERIMELSKIEFKEPTIIQLFTRGKRFCHEDRELSTISKTFFKADFPPGQAALYLINFAALKQAVSYPKAMGDSDWPLWGRKCNFILSYPWAGVEFPSGTTLPIYSRTRFGYYRWQVRVLLGFDYSRWKKAGLNYLDYSFYLIKPLFLRIMMKLKIYKPLKNEDPNSIWVRLKIN